MKKILFICNHLQYSDGAAICLRNLVNAICTNYEVHILNLYIKNPNFVKGISPDVKIHTVFGCYFKGLRSFTNKFLLKRLCNQRFFKDINFDCIVSYQNGTPSVLADYMKKKSVQKSAKFVGFIHGFNPMQIPYYKLFDSIVTISEDGKKLAYEELGSNYDGKVLHLRNIYSMKEIIEKSNVSASEIKELHRNGKVVFATVSRIDSGKGLDRFVKAFSKYHDDNKDAVGVIIGDGPSRKEIAAMIDSKSMNDYVFMLGAKDNPYPYILQSDYFCCPSKSEGLCTSCVEAAILKRPILSTEVSGAHEIIDDPTIGYIVENTDNSFYEGLKKITSLKIDEQNFDISKSKWDPEITAKQYIEFFDKL